MEDAGSNVTGRIVAMAFGLLPAACAQQGPDLTLHLDRPLVIAVAPALNHSGSTDFDAVRVADLMVSELSQFAGVRTLPVNRVLAQLELRHAGGIESPQQAGELAAHMGADRVLVFAITEYDPYEPPVVGITAQLYGPPSADGSKPDALPAEQAGAERHGPQPRAEVQRLFNGQDEGVKREIQAFARQRDAEASPHGWRKFLASQEDYLRFCCHGVLRELIRQEVAHVAADPKRS